MKNKVPKVLMLGWEFPPIINGGLGVACHDLSSALSEKADITMIVPKTSPGFRMKNLNLVGANNIAPSLLGSLPSNYHLPLPFGIAPVPADLDPYTSELEKSGGFSMRQFATSDQKGNAAGQRFDIDNLYGGDVIAKVNQFAEITARLAQKMDFDLIHAHDWMTMIAGIRIREQSGKPLVMHLHSLEVDRSGSESKGWVYQLEKHGMEYADLLLPVSNFTAENIKAHYQISPAKMKVVHNGSRPVQAFKSMRRYQQKTVLFVGRLTRQKGPERFLEIAARVLKRDPEVRFVMAGVGDYFKSVLEQSAYRSIGHRFHLTGFLNVQKLNYLFSVSDVYCMPSVSEPFGLSAVEAAHFGIPCVISKQSGVAEVLGGALKFDYWDVNRGADCILNLLHDKVLRSTIVSHATSDLKRITWENSAEKVINAYSTSNLL